MAWNRRIDDNQLGLFDLTGPDDHSGSVADLAPHVKENSDAATTDVQADRRERSVDPRRAEQRPVSSDSRAEPDRQESAAGDAAVRTTGALRQADGVLPRDDEESRGADVPRRQQQSERPGDDFRLGVHGDSVDVSVPAASVRSEDSRPGDGSQRRPVVEDGTVDSRVRAEDLSSSGERGGYLRPAGDFGQYRRGRDEQRRDRGDVYDSAQSARGAGAGVRDGVPALDGDEPAGRLEDAAAEGAAVPGVVQQRAVSSDGRGTDEGIQDGTAKNRQPGDSRGADRTDYRQEPGRGGQFLPGGRFTLEHYRHHNKVSPYPRTSFLHN